MNMKNTRNTCIKIFISIIAAIGMIATDAHAQELPIEHYTALDNINPLPEPYVVSAYQDSLGYLWIANYGFGLLRYDGQTFEEYSGTDRPLGRQVFALQEDPSGRFWALSSDKGLAVSEQPLSAYAAGAPVQFTDSLGGTPLYRGRVSLLTGQLIRDAHGVLWLGTMREGIIRYRFDGQTTLVADTLATVLRSDSTYAAVEAMITRSDGSVWASVTNETLLVFENGTLTARKQDLPCKQIFKLYEDSRNTLWAGCDRTDVWRLDEETNTWEVVKPAGAEQVQITGIAEVAPGVLWATSLGSGIWELDTTTGATRQYTRRNGLLDRVVWDITTDREGNVWVSQNTGLSKLRTNHFALRSYTNRSFTGERPALSGTEALAAVPGIAWPFPSGDTLQVLAVATSGGLSLIATDGTVEHLTVENGLTSDIVLDVCKDAAERLWIMTRGGFDILSTGRPAPPLPNFASDQQLTLFGGAATLTSYRIGMATTCGTPPQDIMTSGEASAVEEATVCFGKSQRPVVACWVGNRWLFFNPEAGVSDQHIQTLAWDADGHLYAGATHGGLYRSTVPLSSATPDTLVGTDDIVPFVRQPVFERILGGPEEPFNDTGVVKVMRSGQSIWARPIDAATHILEGSPLNVAGLVDQGNVSSLPNTMVYVPATNTVWLATGEGIIEIDTTGQATGRRATQQDGLLFNTASGPNSLQVDTNGTLYHSSTAGLTLYQPARDRRNTTTPLLDFRDIRYNEDNAGSNDLELRYAALSFTSERRVRYRTRLLGYDDTWSAPTSETRVRYTNLSAFAFPKTYTFEVHAANNDGVWTDTPLTHDIRVQPAWWARWWALALYASLFTGIVVVGDRLQRHRLAIKEQERAALREAELRAEAENKRRADTEQLSKIGQTITSTLSIDEIIETVYENVNALMDAAIFGVGIYNKHKNSLDFPATKEKGEMLPYYSISLDDEARLAIWCFKNRKEIIISDFVNEYLKYLKENKQAVEGLEPASILYMPLIQQKNVIGVITTQSFEKNAYSEYHINLLRNLAAYVAIALDNASAYRQLNATLSELKTTQNQLIQQEKLASLGQLTAGIAHEIKNPLNFVNNFSEVSFEMIDEALEELAAVKTQDIAFQREAIAETEAILANIKLNLTKIHEHGSRADGIVKSMLEHSRGGSGKMEPVDFNAMIKEYVNLSFHGMRASKNPIKVDIQLDLDESIGEIPLIAEDFSRVILNLCNNAFDAMRGKMTGDIRPKTVEAYNPKLTVRSKSKDNTITIEIEDNGSGIPDDIKDKILQPFFTTKKGTQGTGLGLSITNDIIKAHGGQVTIETKEHEGTTFIIQLPLATGTI